MAPKVLWQSFQLLSRHFTKNQLANGQNLVVLGAMLLVRQQCQSTAMLLL